MKNKKLRKLINQIHLWLGLLTGIIVFIISITGCIYVFESEIRDWRGESYAKVAPQPAAFVGLGKIVKAFENISKEKIGSIKLLPNRTAATIQIITNKKQSYYFNPYNAELVHTQKSDWLNTVLELHKTLLLGEIGAKVQGWAVVVFLLMLITGLILWFPSQRRLIRQSLTIKWHATYKRINFDMHQVLGFYAAVFLIVIAISGTYFAFSGVKKAVAFVTGTKLSEGIKHKDALADPNKNVAQRYEAIYQQMAPAFIGAESATFSVRKSGELRLRIIYPYQWSRKQNSFFFDEPTGKLLRSKLYKNNTAADWYEATNYDLHTGRLFGYASKILWCLASLIGASLPITGFLIWWKKRRRIIR